MKFLAFWAYCCLTAASFGQTKILTHLTDPNGSFSTRVLLVNADNQPTDYTLQAYDAAGVHLGDLQGALAGETTLARDAAELFPGLNPAHLRIQAEHGLQIFAEYRAKSGGSPAQVPASDTQAPRYQFFPGDWDRVIDGFAVVNTGAQATDLSLRLHNAAGVVKTQQTVLTQLPAGAKGLAVIDTAAFTLEEGDYFQLEGNQPLAFLGLRFNRPGSQFLFEMPAMALPATPEPETGKRQFTLLFTNDEHGWMEPTETHAGAAGMMAQWREQEGYTEDGNFLILSGGDMWTGPAISTWTQGQSMADVMNALQYDAAAIGNHEFDFGLETLAQRAEESDFPFLSANILNPDGTRPAFAKPFTIKKVNGVNVGIIGLTTVSTPSITFPTTTGSFNFIDYETALRETAPLARAHGADVLVVTAHTCTINLLPLADTFAELDLAMVAGGHCNHTRVETASGVTVLEAGSFLRYYGKVAFDVDLDAATVATSAELVENTGMSEDDTVKEVIDFWRAQTDGELNQVIGYSSNGVPRSSALANLISDSWLHAFPGVDIAINNAGGVRQGLPAGEITRADVIGVLPFENILYEVELTGIQISDNVTCCNPLLGGLRRTDRLELMDGTPLQANQVYRVLTPDFLYLGGGGFIFAEQDTTPFDTGLNWRQPLLDLLEELQTTPENPLELYLDPARRKTAIAE